MRTRRKREPRLAPAAAAIGGAILILLLAVLALSALAAWLGLARDAFVAAGLAGLGVLVLYALGLAGWVMFRRTREAQARLRALQLADVDHMDGASFEQYVARLLRQQGYVVTPTGQAGDLGVDLVAGRGRQKVAVQVKRQAGPVSRRAVSDAVAGMAHYDCSEAMVVTNSSFSPGARELARSTRCQLVDRALLARWILAFQKGT